jgi:hypothetical protein
MAQSKPFTRSFGAGELSPAMFGRIDDAKFQSGAAVMQNFIATPQGPAQNRPGFAFVIATKNNRPARLIPFTYDVDLSQTMVIELGVEYIRFHTMGATVLNTDGTPYEIVSPYQEVDLFNIHYVQSADIMTLVQQSYPPMELSRLGPTDWTLTPVNFGAAIGTPTSVAASASPGYLAQIQSITEVAATGTVVAHSLIQTVSAHTLSLGDPIYINGLKNGAGTDLSGFYLVAGVPTDTDGNLITNQLWVMDYSGNTLVGVSPGYALAPGTIQYGTKVFDLNSYYAVAAIAADGSTQGVLSASASALNDLDVPGSYNRITWTAVTGATNYYVFKQKNGLWGYIGETPNLAFTDNNIAPDFTITPINLDSPFPPDDPYPSHSYPAAVGYIEQRRVFAGTFDNPQTVWMSNSGTESTFSYSLPSQDTDRIQVKVAAREVSQIRHIVPLAQLILLTGTCEYAEYTTNDGPVTPSTIGIRPQSYIGSSQVQPSVVNQNLVYCAYRGGHVREMGYALQNNGYITGDLSIRAAHLFDKLTIIDQAFSKAPYPLLWFVSSNGNLLGLTYVPEQQIGSWHHHVTDGIFESVTCVSEDDEDRLYAVIRRVVNGQTVRYIERMGSLVVGDLQDCFFVDSGITFTNGTPVSTLSGIVWLEGQTVTILADGAVQNPKVVTNGKITLDEPASVVQLGLPYTCDLQTLPMTLQIDGYGQGRQKNINKAWVRVFQSSGIFAGPDANSLIEFKQRTTEPYGTPPALQTGIAEIMLEPQWNDEGQILIRQSYPLPLTVSAVTLEVSIGG